MANGENNMSVIRKETVEDKTYRIINIDGVSYSGKDSHKNRSPKYIINAVGGKEYFKGKKILDLACASGAIIFEVKNEILNGTGIDVDNKKLDTGKHIVKEHNIENIFLYESRLEAFISNIKESYDCIFLLNILHHLQDPYGVLSLAAEISNDAICIEAPIESFYNAYRRDENKLPSDILNGEDIEKFLIERNYVLKNKVKSENQDSFIGPERYVYVFEKKKINFVDIDKIKGISRSFVIGTGASGKTHLLHKIYDVEIKYKQNGIIENNVLTKSGKSLKYGSNIHDFTEDNPVLYIAPNFKSLDGFKPNVDQWITELKDKNASAIVCYVQPHVHVARIENRIENKKEISQKQHTDNLYFSYQNLFYKLEKNNIKYFTINMND